MSVEESKRHWNKYIYEGILDDQLQPIVAASWKKCRRAGVDPHGGIGRRVDQKTFQSILQENRELLEVAIPIMQSVYEIVERSHFLLVLTDSLGYVLETAGDKTILEMTRDLRFEPGALWSDLEVGSNAIGIALDYDTAMQMVGPEHFCDTHHGWTCSAAPIHGTNGEVIGCINMSGDAGSPNPHTLGLVVAAAAGIENQLAGRESARLVRTALDASLESIILLDAGLRPIWANKAAEGMLGMPLSKLKQTDFCGLLPDVDWQQLQRWERASQFATHDTRLLVQGTTTYCSATISPTLESGVHTFTVNLRKQKYLIQSVNKVQGNRAAYTFDDIYAKDPRMKKTVALARKYARYEGCILIEGESGTGKELFAQAIHNASNRADGPFVAINCASLPRDLIESELFGYEKGAFTGALKEGNPGKFELANHGTLFLDEIGEMPLEFQAKLLRSVETLQIRRLGGSQEKRLNVRVIAATNRHLREAVEQGRFRQDLYYRLNVLQLTIPPLRERREDIAYCAQKFLSRLNERHPDMEKKMSQQFIRRLEGLNWPGNVRELQNGIERTFYACNGARILEEDIEQMVGRVEEAPQGELRSRPCDQGREGLRQGARDQLREWPEEERGVSQEKALVIAALEAAEGNAGKAAERLGVSRATFYRRLQAYGVNAKAWRRKGGSLA